MQWEACLRGILLLTAVLLAVPFARIAGVEVRLLASPGWTTPVR